MKYLSFLLSPPHTDYKYPPIPVGTPADLLGGPDTPRHTQTASGHPFNRRKPNNSGKDWKVIGTASFATPSF